VVPRSGPSVLLVDGGPREFSARRYRAMTSRRRPNATCRRRSSRSGRALAATGSTTRPTTAKAEYYSSRCSVPVGGHAHRATGTRWRRPTARPGSSACRPQRLVPDGVRRLRINAENAAIRPRDPSGEWTEKNMAHWREQFKGAGRVHRLASRGRDLLPRVLPLNQWMFL